MANISLNLPSSLADDRCRFRVEWTDNDGPTKERYFRSYRSAARFALKKETILLSELMADIHNSRDSTSVRQTTPHQGGT